MSEPTFDQEAVNLGLGFLADIAVHSARIVHLREGRDDDGEETHEADFGDLYERVRQAREYIARRTETMRQERAKEATEPKSD